MVVFVFVIFGFVFLMIMFRWEGSVEWMSRRVYWTEIRSTISEFGFEIEIRIRSKIRINIVGSINPSITIVEMV